MSTSHAEDSGGAAIPTWQIVLAVLAVAFVLWRVVAYVSETRRTAPTTFESVAPAPVVNPAQPGTHRHRMYEEK